MLTLRRSFQRILLLVALILSCHPCEAVPSSWQRGVRILGALPPASMPRARALKDDDTTPSPQPKSKSESDGTTESPTTNNENSTPENNKPKERSDESACSDAKDCDDCAEIALTIGKAKTGKTCRWIKENDDDSTKSCQSIDIASAKISLETMCAADTAADEPAVAPKENSDKSETAAPTIAPTSTKADEPSKAVDAATSEPTKAPVTSKAAEEDATTSEPTKAPVSAPSKSEEDVSTTSEPTKAPTMKPIETADKPIKPAANNNKEPTPAKMPKTPAPTKKPVREPEYKPSTDDYDDEDDMMGGFGPKQIGGITFAVVLMILYARCCRRSSAVDYHKGPTHAIIPPRGGATPSTYSRVSVADPIEDDNADDWGWDDNNIGGSGSGDLEMSNKAPSPPAHRKASPPPPMGRMTAGLSLERPPAPATTNTRADITLSSRGVNKKTTPAKTLQDPDDIFSEMGLAAKPKFGKPGPRKLGAVPLPKDSDDWGDDDGLDDLLDD